MEFFFLLLLLFCLYFLSLDFLTVTSIRLPLQIRRSDTSTTLDDNINATRYHYNLFACEYLVEEEAWVRFGSE